VVVAAGEQIKGGGKQAGMQQEQHQGLESSLWLPAHTNALHQHHARRSLLLHSDHAAMRHSTVQEQYSKRRSSTPTANWSLVLFSATMTFSMAQG
jgi:hypothetical protein